MAPKYSSPTLRPPMIVAWLSAVNDLLCMRRLAREKSVRKPNSLGLRGTNGIEEPHLDVGMGVERGQRRVDAAGAVVVQQQPHPHAALGGVAQGVEQQRARRILVPDVVLDVERAVGGPRQERPRGEGIAASRRADGYRSFRDALPRVVPAPCPGGFRRCRPAPAIRPCPPATAACCTRRSISRPSVTIRDAATHGLARGPPTLPRPERGCASCDWSLVAARFHRQQGDTCAARGHTIGPGQPAPGAMMSQRMPAIFFGHGNPMNALAQNT